MTRTKSCSDELIISRMLDFVIRWRHWGGGPDEDIFIEFGVTPRVFFGRIQANLGSDVAARHGKEAVAQLESICRIRLARNIGR